MSYQEKRTIASVAMSVLVLAAYCIYAFGGRGDGGLRFYGMTMLAFVGVGIAANVVLQIIFHIGLSVSVAARERNAGEQRIKKAVEAAVVEDEMDRLIELKTMRAGFVVCGAGFLAGLALVALGSEATVMLNVLFLSFSASMLVSDGFRLYYYRAGVKNGR